MGSTTASRTRHEIKPCKRRKFSSPGLYCVDNVLCYVDFSGTGKRIIWLGIPNFLVKIMVVLGFNVFLTGPENLHAWETFVILPCFVRFC